MVVPEFELICEIMLVAEGFVEARLLARKFITLYTLCKELLSKQVWNMYFLNIRYHKDNKDFWLEWCDLLLAEYFLIKNLILPITIFVI